MKWKKHATSSDSAQEWIAQIGKFSYVIEENPDATPDMRYGWNLFHGPWTELGYGFAPTLVKAKQQCERHAREVATVFLRFAQEKCRHADKYQAKAPPRCNGGVGCYCCWSKWIRNRHRKAGQK